MTHHAARARPSPWRRGLRGARRALYWILPPVILWVIFARVDLDQARALLATASTGGLGVGVAMGLLVTGLGALRWLVLVRHRVPATAEQRRRVLGDYWRGIAAGTLAPGTLGLDAYRIAALGRRTADYLAPAGLVAVEKLLAVAACAAVAAVALPPAGIGALDPTLAGLRWTAVGVASLAVAVLAASCFEACRAGWRRASRRLATVARRAIGPAARAVGEADAGPDTVRGLGRPALLVAIGLSVAVYLASAAQAHLLFAAIGSPTALIVNVAIAPLIFLALAVPISFATIGVREAAYVVLYRAFGVPAEAALIVSFCTLAGTLLSAAVGATMMLATSRRHAT